MTKRQYTFVVLVLAATMSASHSQADELQSTAQKLAQQYNKALVRVHAISREQDQAIGISFGKKDQVSLSQGIVIDKNGLTIVSRSSFDPSVLRNMFLAGLPFNLGGEEAMREAKNKFKKIEMELADGTRVPARVLIVDPKYDVVVVAPKKPLDADKFAYVPIDTAKGANVDVMDDLIFLRRLNPLLNNEIAVGVMAVSAVTEKPTEMFYTRGMQSSLPAFNTKGELLGISIVKRPTNGTLADINDAQYGVLSCKYFRMVLEQARKNFD